jgi:hypothetical protein
MRSRSTLLAGLAVLSACYSGPSQDDAASDATVGTTHGATASTGAPGPGDTGEPTTGSATSSGAVTLTSAGSTDMSEGPASSGGLAGGTTSADPDTGVAETGEPGTETGAPGTTDTGDPPPDEAAKLCQRWNADRAQLGEGTWSGSVDACDPGTISQDGRDNALRLVNLYRLHRRAAAGHGGPGAHDQGPGLRADDARQRPAQSHAADELEVLDRRRRGRGGPEQHLEHARGARRRPLHGRPGQRHDDRPPPVDPLEQPRPGRPRLDGEELVHAGDRRQRQRRQAVARVAAARAWSRTRRCTSRRSGGPTSTRPGGRSRATASTSTARP